MFMKLIEGPRKRMEPGPGVLLPAARGSLRRPLDGRRRRSKPKAGKRFAVIFDALALDYARRWGIETLFKCLKSGGYNLEDTHLRSIERIDVLIGLLAIAFVLAYIAGDLEIQSKPLKIKSHGRKAKSVFRAGLDFIACTMADSIKKSKEYQILIRILPCTWRFCTFPVRGCRAA